MTEKVLIVDDEPNILEGISRQLRKDFDVHTAPGGREALKTLETDGPFAVIVCDMRMPGMNGVEVLRALKRLAPETVRIMLTGCSDQETAIEAINEGNIFRFLTKPCPPEILTKSIKEGLNQYLLNVTEKTVQQDSIEELVETREKLHEQQSALDSVTDALYMLNEDMELVKWNKAMEVLTCLPAGELRGRMFSSFFTEEEKAPVANAIHRIFEKDAGTVEANLIVDNDHIMSLLLSAAPLKDKDGKVVGIVGSARDNEPGDRNGERTK
jgi:PAS domain S-box-containing protein